MSRETRRVVGLAGAACAACCAGPIVAFPAAVGAAMAVGLTLFGVVGAIVTSATIPVMVRHRRGESAPDAPVPVGIVARTLPSGE